MRIVLDTNILVSGLLDSKGPPGRLLRAWSDGLYLLITSDYQVRELSRVLSYDRLRHRIPAKMAGILLTNLSARAEVVSDLPEVDLSSDPKDNPILATALTGKANLIVTGDKRHLLSLESVQAIRIVTAADAVQQLGL